LESNRVGFFLSIKILHIIQFKTSLAHEEIIQVRKDELITLNLLLRIINYFIVFLNDAE
jgi:hypothetical protein